MACPICAGERLPPDASLADRHGRRVASRGRVNAVASPQEAAFTPFGLWHTVTLYPRKGKVKYLKFRTSQELGRWPFARDETYEVNGCFHVVDGKELIFDITRVEVGARG